MSTVLDFEQLRATGQRSLVTKHQTYTLRLRELFDLRNPRTGDLLQQYNATTAVIRQLIGRAVAERVRMRALGGNWSFSRVANTDGWLVNTKPMNLDFRILATLVHPAYTGDRAGLRFCQGGCEIVELNQRLLRDGRSLRTTGASNGQTIAGALATGTHGSAIAVGAIPEYVVGLHLVVGPDRHVYLERASRPAAADAFAARLGAELVRDDALFDAALVSFGSFGVVHGVMIETDPLFVLDFKRQRRTLDDGLRRAIETLDFSRAGLPRGAEAPYHFQVVLNPFDSQRGAYVATAYRGPVPPGFTPPPPQPNGVGPGDDLLSFVGQLSDAVPQVISLVAGQLLGRAYRDLAVRGTLGDIFTATRTEGKATATSFGVPLDRAGEVREIVSDLNRREGPFAVLQSYRYVRATRATLGFTRFGPTCCVFELDGGASRRTAEYFRRVWQVFRERGIPHTFHWGKEFPQDPGSIRAAYGGAVDRWIAARERLLAPEVRRVFSNDLLENIGLAT
ncbi:MAG TPA: FAD-binding protein [Longimicrobiaceae bacterium]|nr:FAD-binding protein [Longimicrobiaceae bacterium]